MFNLAQYGEDKIAPTNAENEKIKKIEDSQPNKLQIELERALQNAGGSKWIKSKINNF